MSESIFSRIAKREAQAHIVFESDLSMAILDIAPAAQGHTILFPKEQYQVLAQIPDETLVDLILALRLVRHATIAQDPSVEGVTSLIAQGPAGGQRAPHLIIHTIPRLRGDGLFSEPGLAGQTVPELSELFDRSDGLLVEAADPAYARGEVLVIDESCDVFEELDASRIGVFASAIRESSAAVFENLEAQGTTVLIESGISQDRAGALARVIPRSEEDPLSFEWQPGKKDDLRVIFDRFTRTVARITQQGGARSSQEPRPESSGQGSAPRERTTNYLLKQLERLP